MKRWDISDVKHAGKVRQHESRRDQINQAAAQAGVGSIVLGLVAVALFIISFTPAYSGDGMKEWIEALRILGGIFGFAAAVMFWFHHVMDV
ncbi:MAG TPA: hypothetical protein VLA04_05675 [Verrucomicrobiae bacterium]|nr:hypothetical protein [Verrucomicrobiae bacterium]